MPLVLGRCPRLAVNAAPLALKEYVQAASPSFAAIERDPQRLILTIDSPSEKPFTNTPHLNPLPVSGARRSERLSVDLLGSTSRMPQAHSVAQRIPGATSQGSPRARQSLTFILSLWQRERRGPRSVCRVSQREHRRTRALSRGTTASCYASTVLISTSDMSGIEIS